jgi:PAS domain S-box-containing protein
VPFSYLTDQNAGARLAGLLDSAMDAIISVDEAQNIVIYNRAAEKIFGWTFAQVQGKPLNLLIPDRFKHRHGAHMRQFGSTGVTSRRMGDGTVLWGLRAGGEEFPMEASISQLETPEGRIYTAILRDVTERVRAQEELAALAAEASGIREQEKSRIARELHDELAQSLTALKMDTLWVREHFAHDATGAQAKLAAMLAMLDASVASTRRIAADLRPLLLDDLGLAPAIEWLVQNFSQRHGLPCGLDIDEDLDLGEPWATAVFRIVQESLVNVAKHARAGNVNVRVALEDGALALSVQDDGTGFRVDDPRKPQSLGLFGLRERVHQLKGSVTIDSEPGRGTRIEVRLPVPAGGGA